MNKFENNIKLIIINIMFLLLSQSVFLEGIAQYIYIVILFVEFMLLWRELAKNVEKNYKKYIIYALLIMLFIYILKDSYYSFNSVKATIEIDIILLIVIRIIYKNKSINIKNIILFALILIILTVLLQKLIGVKAYQQISFVLVILNIIIQLYFYKKSFEKNIDKTKLTNIDKIISVLLVLIFLVYNTMNCRKVLKNYKEVNDFINEITITNINDYKKTINEYKKKVEEQSDYLTDFHKEREEILKTSSKKAQNSIFIYDGMIYECEHMIEMTRQLLFARAVNNSQSNKERNKTIEFLNNMQEALEPYAKFEKNFIIILAFNTIITSCIIGVQLSKRL